MGPICVPALAVYKLQLVWQHSSQTKYKSVIGHQESHYQVGQSVSNKDHVQGTSIKT